MPLIECPECKKSVSSFAKACPNCGYPICEMETVQIMLEEPKKEKRQINIVKTFNLGGSKLEITEDFDIYNNFRIRFEEIAQRARNLSVSLYAEEGSIGKALEALPALMVSEQGEAFDLAQKIFYELGVVVSMREFVEKYYDNFSYDRIIEPVLKTYLEIKEKNEYLQQYREIQKRNRSRWQGGGFGVTGAIKGAVIAGVLNTGTDMIRGIADSEQKRSDNANVEKKMQMLYANSDVRKQLTEGTFLCIMSICDAVRFELMERERIEVSFDVNSAETIFESTVKFSNSAHESFDNIMKAIRANVYEGKYYITLLKTYLEILVEEGYEQQIKEEKMNLFFSELKAVLSYLSLEQYLNVIEENDINNKADKIIRTYQLFKGLTLTNITLDGYKKLCFDYRELYIHLGEALPKTNRYAQFVLDYERAALGKFHEKLDEDAYAYDIINVYRYYESEPTLSVKCLTIEDYIEEIFINHRYHSEKSSFFNRNYLKGKSIDFEQKIKKVEEYTNKKLKNPIYCYDSSDFQNLKKGVVFTQRELFIIEKARFIRLDDIIQCERKYSDTIVIEIKTEEFITIKTESSLLARYIESILKLFCINMYRFDLRNEENDVVPTENSDMDSSEGNEIVEESKIKLSQEANEIVKAYLSENNKTKALLLLDNYVKENSKLQKQEYGDTIKYLAVIKDEDEIPFLVQIVSTNREKIFFEMVKYGADLEVKMGSGITLFDVSHANLIYNLESKEAANIYDYISKLGISRKVDFILESKYKAFKEYGSFEEYIVEVSSKIITEEIINNDIYTDIGTDVILQKKKSYSKAKINFGIPSENKVYLIMDGTVLRSCKKGFAFTDKGVHYSLGTQPEVLCWKELRSLSKEQIDSFCSMFNMGVGARPLLMKRLFYYLKIAFLSESDILK